MRGNDTYFLLRIDLSFCAVYLLASAFATITNAILFKLKSSTNCRRRIKSKETEWFIATDFFFFIKTANNAEGTKCTQFNEISYASFSWSMYPGVECCVQLPCEPFLVKKTRKRRMDFNSWIGIVTFVFFGIEFSVLIVTVFWVHTSENGIHICVCYGWINLIDWSITLIGLFLSSLSTELQQH